jgi:hypothetical protein
MKILFHSRLSSKFIGQNPFGKLTCRAAFRDLQKIAASIVENINKNVFPIRVYAIDFSGKSDLTRN